MKKELDEVLSLCARMQLFVDDEVEPTNEETLAADLEALYLWLVKVERTARAWRQARMN